MSMLATTRMSSKGQIVIPEELRRAFGWDSGTSFIVVGRPDAIMLQPVAMPDMARFDDLNAEGRRDARRRCRRRSRPRPGKETVEPLPLPGPVCEDPGDDMFIACALTARARVILH